MSKANEVALWAALAAFFGSLLAIGIFDILNPDQWAEDLGAILVGAITGGAIYAKERLGFAKKRANGKSVAGGGLPHRAARHPPTPVRRRAVATAAPIWPPSPTRRPSRSASSRETS